MIDISENVYVNHVFYNILIFITLINFFDIRNLDTSILSHLSITRMQANRKLLENILSLCYNLQQ